MTNPTPMTAKEYLEQAYRIDQRINSKLVLLDDLRALATNVTAHLSDMPRNNGSQPQSMEATIVKIVDMQRELDANIDTLVDLKREINAVLRTISSARHQLVLEQRYLRYMSWERIATELGYSIQHVHRLHEEALKKICVPAKTCE